MAPRQRKKAQEAVKNLGSVQEPVSNAEIDTEVAGSSGSWFCLAVFTLACNEH